MHSSPPPSPPRSPERVAPPAPAPAPPPEPPESASLRLEPAEREQPREDPWLRVATTLSALGAGGPSGGYAAGAGAAGLGATRPAAEPVVRFSRGEDALAVSPHMGETVQRVHQRRSFREAQRQNLTPPALQAALQPAVEQTAGVDATRSAPGAGRPTHWADAAAASPTPSASDASPTANYAKPRTSAGSLLGRRPRDEGWRHAAQIEALEDEAATRYARRVR